MASATSPRRYRYQITHETTSLDPPAGRPRGSAKRGERPQCRKEELGELTGSFSRKPSFIHKPEPSQGSEGYWNVTVSAFDDVPATETLRLTVPVPAKLPGRTTLT